MLLRRVYFVGSGVTVSLVRYLCGVVFSFITILGLSACTGEGPWLGEVESTVYGTASALNGTNIELLFSKGPVNGARCSLYDSNSNKLAGPVTTNREGVSSFGLVEGVQDDTFVYVWCKGGSYTDEATGQKAFSNSEMRSGAKVKDSSADVQIVITPVTEVAFRKASADGALSNIETYNQNVAKALGMGNGFDAATIKPTDVNTKRAADDKFGRYGTLLAGISQLQETSGVELIDVLDNLEMCIDGKSGLIDKVCAQEMIDSLTQVQNSGHVGDNLAGTPPNTVRDNLGDVSEDTGRSFFAITDVVSTVPNSDDNRVLYRFVALPIMTVTGKLLGEVIAVSVDGIMCDLDPDRRLDTTFDLICDYTPVANAEHVVFKFSNEEGVHIYRKIALKTLPPNTVTLNTATKSIAYQSTTSNPAGCIGGGDATYVSSNSEIASVDSLGVVTGRSIGQATITASCAAVPHAFLASEASYQVNVTEAIIELSWSLGGDQSIGQGKIRGFEQTASVSPTICSMAAPVRYSISTGSDVAEVDANTGAITLIDADHNGLADVIGTATVVAETVGVEGLCAPATSSYVLTVEYVPANLPTYSGGTATIFKTFGDAQFRNVATCTLHNDEAVQYASSDQNVASVGENGLVTIQGVGEAVIIATCPADSVGTIDYTSGTNTYIVRVDKATPKLTWSPSGDSTIRYGEQAPLKTLSINAFVDPNARCDAPFTYSSSYEMVATVDGSGTITTHQEGTTIISGETVETANCNAAVSSYTLVVNPSMPPDKDQVNQVRELNSDAVIKVYGDDSFSVKTASCADSNSFPSYTTSASPDVIVSGRLITIVSRPADGKAIIRVTCPETDDYLSSDASYVVTIAKAAAPTLRFATEVENDGRLLRHGLVDDNPATATITSGLLNGDTEAVGTIVYSVDPLPNSFPVVNVNSTTGALSNVAWNANVLDASVDVIATFISNNYQDATADYSLTVYRLIDPTSHDNAAYALRRLDSGYSGDALEVRVRSSNSDTESFNDPVLQVGFDGNGNLDLSASVPGSISSLAAMAEEGNVFISKWYDQAGGGIDLASTSLEQQPRLVQVGKRWAISFSGQSALISTNALPTTPTKNLFVFLVQSRIKDANYHMFNLNYPKDATRVAGSLSSFYHGLYWVWDAGGKGTNGGGRISVEYAIGLLPHDVFLHTTFIKKADANTNSQIIRTRGNTIAASSKGIASITVNKIALGTITDSSHAVVRMQEFIVLLTDQSRVVETIENDEMHYWKVF